MADPYDVHNAQFIQPSDEELRMLYESGQSVAQVARATGLSHGVARRRLIAAGTVFRSRSEANRLIRIDDERSRELARRTHKRCTDCGEVQPIEEFPFRAGGRLRKSMCRDCVSVRYKAWYAENRKYAIEKSREYYREHFDDISPVAVARAKRWAEKNPERRRIHSINQEGKRRAQKRATATGPVNYERIIARDNWTCHICGKPIPEGDNHFDHVIPLSRGGTHTEDNIRMSHSRCNIRKANRLEYDEVIRG